MLKAPIILIIEDDEDIQEMLEYNLQKESFQTLTALTGPKAFEILKNVIPDLILLDIMLPVMDGFEICKKLKNTHLFQNIPIIMLTAKSQKSDIIEGLELGADDYITKPFSIKELIARIKVVLRRNNAVKIKSNKIEHNELVIDTLKHKVTISGKKISLTKTEFKILKYLAEKPGIVHTRENILDDVFNYKSMTYDRVVDAHMKTLRKKLGKKRDQIETIRGIGYCFKDFIS